MKLRRPFLKGRLSRLGTVLLALWKLLRHPATPMAARVAALLALVYALSPVDLIPDVVPLLGWLDDLVIVPALVALAVRLTPRMLWRQRMAEAEQLTGPTLRRIAWGTAGVLALWLLLVTGLAVWLWRAWS